MGQTLLAFYEAIKKEGGTQMEMRLAMKTGIPSAKAGAEADSPNNIQKFKAAYKEIAGKDAPVS